MTWSCHVSQAMHSLPGMSCTIGNQLSIVRQNIQDLLGQSAINNGLPSDICEKLITYVTVLICTMHPQSCTGLKLCSVKLSMMHRLLFQATISSVMTRIDVRVGDVAIYSHSELAVTPADTATFSNQAQLCSCVCEEQPPVWFYFQ